MQIDLLRQKTYQWVPGTEGRRRDGLQRGTKNLWVGKWKCSISLLWWFLHTYTKLHGNVHFKWVWFIACK